jgi:hypothetical protein
MERLSAIQKSLSTKVLTDVSSNGLRTKSSSRRPGGSEQTCRRDLNNRTIDDITGFKDSNPSHMIDANSKCEISRRATFEPLPRRNRSNHNQSQLLSRRTSRQYSNLSELSEVDNTHTLRMKRDSI